LNYINVNTSVKFIFIYNIIECAFPHTHYARALHPSVIQASQTAVRHWDSMPACKSFPWPSKEHMFLKVLHSRIEKPDSVFFTDKIRFVSLL